MALRVFSGSVRAWSRMGLRRASGEATYMSYEASTGSSVGVQRIKTLQKTFEETGHDPDLYIHLPRDVPVYKSLMVFSVFAIGTALTCVYKMAVGSMPPKDR